LGEIIMALYNAEPGIGMVSEYQSAGTPFVHSAQNGYTLTFAYVTKAIHVHAAGANATISFGDEDDTTFTLPNGQCLSFELRCKTITITSGAIDVGVVAELTGIPASKLGTHDQADLGSA